jgi:glutamyl-tRNA synthetase
MVQSPTFDQTRRRFGAYFALSLLQRDYGTWKCTDKNCFLIKERAHFVSEFWELSDFFFVAPSEYDAKATKNWKAETPALMQN